MSNLVRGHVGRAAGRNPAQYEEWGPVAGRHAINEDAVLTPIFHALTRGGWRSRQHEPAAPSAQADPVDAFRRDPLTAPIPVQALVPSPVMPEPADHGRHRHRRHY